MKKFIKILKSKNIDYKIIKDKIIITKNQGYVDLESLTSLPEGIKFENQGNVDLESLTSLPEGIKFENQGNVDLRSLTEKYINYKNKKLIIKIIDDYTMIIDNKKTKNNFIIYNCRYFGGGDLNKLKKVYVAKKGKFYAHGKTIKQAVNDVNFKYLQENFDLNEIVSEIKTKKTISVNEYRLLTGACSVGVQNFIEENNIKESELPLNKVIEITKGYWGNSKLLELFT